MKKTLIALAALAAAGAVSAQSAVTLYGRLDLGFANASSESKNSAGVTQGTNSNTSLAGAANELSGSRLGIAGTEDLGGGVSAFFNYALNINPDTTGSSVGSTRLANAGLRSGYGTVTIGTFDNAIDSARGLGNAGSKNFADAFGQETGTTPTLLSSGNIGGAISSEFGFAGHISGKSQNTINYQTPSVNGFTGQLALNSQTSDPIANNNETKNKATILGLNYEAGPIETQFAYGKQRAEIPAVAAVTRPVTNNAGVPIGGGIITTTPAVPARDTNASDWVFSVSYDLGVANPRLIYESSEGKTSGTNIKRKVNYYAISTDFDLEKFQPWVTLAYGKLTSNAPTTVTNTSLGNTIGLTGVKQLGYELGVSYMLSQRTSLYSFYNNEKAKVDSTGMGNGWEFTTDNLAVGVLHTF